MGWDRKGKARNGLDGIGVEGNGSERNGADWKGSERKGKVFYLTMNEEQPNVPKGFETKYGAEKAKLFEVMKANPESALLTYAQIKGVIGEDPQTAKGRAIVLAVINRLERYHEISYKNERYKGYFRTSPAAAVQYAGEIHENKMKGLHRVMRVANCADYDRLTPEEKREHNTLVSVTGAQLLFTNKKSLVLIREKVIANQSKLDVEATLKLFQK